MESQRPSSPPGVTARLARVEALLEQLLAAKQASSAGESEPEGWVDSQKIAKHFGVSRATLHSWVHRGGCPHALRGKVLRFQLSAVSAWYVTRGIRQ